MNMNREWFQKSGSRPSLITIDEALTRLNRLGVEIRAASRGRIQTKIHGFASRLDLLPVLGICQAVVGSLYPATDETPKFHLCQGILDHPTSTRYAASLSKR